MDRGASECFYTAQSKVNFCTCARISFSGGKIHPGHRCIKSQYRGDLGTTSVGRGESYHLCKQPPHSSSEEILCNKTRVAGCCLLHTQVSTLPAWKEVSSTHRSQQPHLVVPVQTSWGTACSLARGAVSVWFWHRAQSWKTSFKRWCDVKMWWRALQYVQLLSGREECFKSAMWRM